MTLPLINSNILWCHRSSGCETCKSLCWLSSYSSELIQNLSVYQLHFSIFSDFLIWNLRKTIHQGCHLPYFLEFSRTQNRIQIFHLLLEECPSFLNQTLLPEKKKRVSSIYFQLLHILAGVEVLHEFSVYLDTNCCYWLNYRYFFITQNETNGA